MRHAPIEIGHIEAIFRYPVKSMAGERLESAELGWHGIEGDRRFALQRIGDMGKFPFLTAGKLPDLVRYVPVRRGDGPPADAPTHVLSPEGVELPLHGDELATELGRRHGTPVRMMQFKNGIFDDATISVIANDTVNEIGRLAGLGADVRRFRPNILVHLTRPTPFQEDGWVGGSITFGEGENAPTIAVTMRDLRCAMVNIDPDTAALAPAVMKAVAKTNQNNAGVYGTVTRSGRIAVGQSTFLCPRNIATDGETCRSNMKNF
jgi:hypothetical protein